MESTLERIDAPSALSGDAERQRLSAAWWGVVAVFLVHGLVVSTWVSRIAAVKAGLGLSDGALGLALLGSAIGSMLAIPVAGWAVSRHGSRTTTQWTCAGFALSLLLLASAPNIMALFAALMVYGAMAGANDVTINAQGVSVEKRLGKPAMSRFHAMFSLGGMFGAALGGYIASRGVSPGVHFASSVAVILSVVWFSRPFLLDTCEKTAEPARMQLSRPPAALLVLSAIGFCIFLSEGAIADWTAVYLKQVLRTGEGTAAAGYAAFSAAMTIFRFSGDAITVRLGRHGPFARAALWLLVGFC